MSGHQTNGNGHAPRPETAPSCHDPYPFNQGSDARLRGEPEGACPYAAGTWASAWRRGWRDVDEHWGELVRGRWPFRPLPEVKP